MFPERVHYSRADGSGWPIKDWDTANHLLGYLDPTRNHFVIFELPGQSYIQCLGSKTALVVECRESRTNGSFTHWVFGKSSLTGTTSTVGPETNVVTVDSSQVLSMRDARVLIRQFLETRTFHDRYTRTDVSSRFK
jgi:hypothetical protein